MADTLQFDLVSPERKLASVEATEVQIPGAEGDMTAMPDHSPLVTTLRPGVITVHSSSGVAEYVVTGGFAEISAQSTTVLAEQALPKADVTREFLEAALEDAKAVLAEAPAEIKASAALRVNDMSELMAQIG
ncbi:MAG: F0F1 ATP synthase subunit epsilon [Paracoccaceae bacterium]